MPWMVSMLKMTLFQSMAICSLGNAEHGDLAAVAHVVDHVAEGGGVAAHLQADIEAFLHAELLLHVGDARLHVHRHRRAHFAGEIEAILVHVGDDDIRAPACFTMGWP
jgi:hypothetical protein